MRYWTQHWPPLQSSLPSHADLTVPVQLAPQLGPLASQQQFSGESQLCVPHATHEAWRGSQGPVLPPVPPVPESPPPVPPVPPRMQLENALDSESHSPAALGLLL